MKIKLIISIVILNLCFPQKLEKINKICEAGFRGLTISPDNTIWVSGTKGTILKSIDFGEKWELINAGNDESDDYRDIEAFNKDTAVIMKVGSPGKIFFTKDGGKIWELRYQNDHPAVFFDSMCRINKNGLIAFSDPIDDKFYLIKSDNSGIDWRSIVSDSICYSIKGESAFAASGTCVVSYGKKIWMVTGGSESRVIFSSDYGEKWINSKTIYKTSSATQGFYSVDFCDELYGIIVGGDYTKKEISENNLFISDDGGINWKKAENPPLGFKSCIKFSPVNKKMVVVTGTSGTDISYDRGINWKHIDDESYNVCDFSKDGRFVFFAGDRGNLAKMEIKQR